MKGSEEMSEMPKIRVIGTDEAVKILAEHGMTTTRGKLGLGLQQGVYPFGVAIKMSEWCYEIYYNMLMKWIEERAC